MKSLALDADTATRFWNMYQAAFPRLADADRTPEAFRLLCMDRNAQIFHGPGDTVIVLTGVNIPQHTAMLHMFAENPWVFRKRGEFWMVFHELMELFHLYKMNVFVPAPSRSVWKLYSVLGFKHEGTLRKSVMFNQDLVDIEMYGILREEVKENLDAKRNRVPKRRSNLVERTFGKTTGVRRPEPSVARRDDRRAERASSG
jgi:hypothetical protein